MSNGELTDMIFNSKNLERELEKENIISPNDNNVKENLTELLKNKFVVVEYYTTDTNTLFAATLKYEK